MGKKAGRTLGRLSDPPKTQKLFDMEELKRKEKKRYRMGQIRVGKNAGGTISQNRRTSGY